MAVTVDAVSSAATNTTATGATGVTHALLTIGASATAATFEITIFNPSNTDPTSVTATWDNGGTNQNCPTIVSKVFGAGNLGRSVWLVGLTNPTSGTNTFKVTCAGTSTTVLDWVVAGQSWKGTDTTGGATTFNHTASADDSAGVTSPATVTVTTTTSDAVVAVHMTDATMSAISNTAGFTTGSGIVQQATSGLYTGVNYEVGGATATLTATAVPADNWLSAGTNIKAASAGAGLPAGHIDKDREENPVILPFKYYDWQNFRIPVGQDILPKNRYDWPNPEYVRPTYREYTVLDRTVNLIGKDTLPLNQYKWPNPNLNVYYDDYSWDDFYSLSLLGKDTLPRNQYNWPVPLGPVPKVTDWQYYLNPPGFPIVQVRVEVPYGPLTNPFWTFNLRPPAFPSVSVRSEVPYGPTTNPFWIEYTLPFNYPAAVAPTPQVCMVWYVPRIVDIKVTDWQDYIIPVGQDIVPGSRTYEVPKAPYYPDQTFYQYLIALYSALPIGTQVYFVPTGALTNPYYISYIIPAGQDQLPFNQKSWPVPQGAIPGQDWQQSYNNVLNFVVQPGPPGILFNQNNWPNPTILLIGRQDWQSFLTNIPAPVPTPVQLLGGRTDEQIDGRIWREGIKRLEHHLAAVALGTRGGIQSGKSRRTR